MAALSSATLIMLAWYAAALALGLAITLTLAAWCTPRAWWRRPNVRALTVAAGGTLLFGWLLAMGFAPPRATSPVAPTLAAAVTADALPLQGASYRVVEHLNLRQAHGVRASRVIVLPAGTRVRTTGAVDGDWWQVHARLDGREVDGWASSLWLRRVDEGRAAGR